MSEVYQAANAPALPASNPPYDYDVTIVGAGPVGLALAGWLARRRPCE